MKDHSGGQFSKSSTAGFLTLILAQIVGAAPLPIADVNRDSPVDFAKDIYPVLKRSCLACHNTTKAKAGLNLESPQTIQKGGDTGPAALPGKGAESLLLRTSSHAEDPAMPPPGNKVNATDLSSEELGLIRLWIDQGMIGGAVVENVSEWRSFPLGQAPVTAAALSAGGRIAAAARGNRVQLTEVATGVSLGFLTDPELAKLDIYKDKMPADRDAVMAVSFGGDDLVATGGFRTARIWRRAPLRPQISLELPSTATCLASVESLTAAGNAAGMIHVWDSAAEKPVVEEWKEHAAPVKTLCLSPDRKWLLSAAEDKSFRVWSVSEKKVVFRVEAPAVVTALCFLKSGTELAAGFSDGMLRVYPFTTDSPATPPGALREYKLGDQPVTFLATPDGASTRLIWTNADPAFHLLETADGKRLDVALENPAQAAASAAERRQQAAKRAHDAFKARLAAATDTLKKDTENLRATNGAQEKARADWQRKLAASRAADDALRMMPEDGKRKEAAKKSTEEADKAERTFTDARTNAELAVRLTGQSGQAQAAAEGAASAAETTLAEATVDVESGKKNATLLPAPKAATLLEDGKTVLVAFDGGRIQWHAVDSGAFLDAAEILGGPVAFSAGTHVMAALPDKKVLRLPSRRPFVLERQMGAHDDPGQLAGRVTALSFSSDARLLATGGGVPSRSGEVKIWRVLDGSQVLSIPEPHSDTVNSLAFSPDDSLIATAGSDRWARVFRTVDGKCTTTFEGHSSAVLAIAWRGDGLALATGGSDKTLRFWDYFGGKQTRAITSFGKEVSALTFIGIGDTIASASGDEGVRLNEEKLPGSKGFCFTLACDPSGRLVAAGGEDGVLRVWDSTAKKLLMQSQ